MSEEVDRMNKMVEVLNLNPLVRRVMEAERRLGIVFDDVNRIVGDALRDLVSQ